MEIYGCHPYELSEEQQGYLTEMIAYKLLEYQDTHPQETASENMLASVADKPKGPAK